MKIFKDAIKNLSKLSNLKNTKNSSRFDIEQKIENFAEYLDKGINY